MSDPATTVDLRPMTVGRLLRLGQQALARRDAFVPWGCMHDPQPPEPPSTSDPAFTVTLARDVSPVTTSGTPSPGLDAEILLAFALECSRTDLYRDRDRLIEDERLKQYQRLIEERAHGVPIAYLTGHREFWSLDLLVSRATLIPRPETELLVERALAMLPAREKRRVADLGTGSGAVALAIASERPHYEIVATDVSGSALTVAMANARRLDLANVQFNQGAWLAALDSTPFDLIVSNPPYIGEKDPHLEQGDVRFEPRRALVSGADGLEALREIVAGSREHLRKGGWLMVEHGMTQGASVRSLMLSSGYWEIATHRDLAGLERVTQAQWNGHDA
jgi:release factor glutamine methyltransferase